MFKNIASLSAVTAMLILSGCNSVKNSLDDTFVKPGTTNPTGSNAKLQQAIEQYDSNTKQKLNLLKNLADENSLTGLGLDLGKLTPGGESAGGDTGGPAKKVTGNQADSCIHDGIVTNETNTSATAKGTLTFTNCTLPNGTKINGSITVDFSANGQRDSQKFDVTYSGHGNIAIVSADNSAKIIVSQARTKGSVAYNDDRGTAENQSGISAYLEDNGNKFLILDGINTKETNAWREEGKSYTFAVSGFVGSDDTGMFQVATPVTVKGTQKCPSEGKVTLTDAGGSVFTIKANGTNITTDIDGNVTHTYSCDGSAAGGSASE